MHWTFDASWSFESATQYLGARADGYYSGAPGGAARLEARVRCGDVPRCAVLLRA